MSRCYSTRELAKLWDVSESTIKRWADTGALSCRKTAGGHRKFDLKDVLEFARHSGIGPQIEISGEPEPLRADDEVAELLVRGDLPELASRYLSAALAGRYEATAALLTRAYGHGLALATIGDEIIRPAMFEIGERWRSGKIKVFEEHLATFSTLQALADLQAIVAGKPNTGRGALVGCSEGEHHQVAATLVRHLLESEGWTVIYLGAHTPLFSFADAVNKFKPDLACISVTMMDHLERAAFDFELLSRAAARHGTRVLMGGAAMGIGEVRARFREATHATSLGHLLELLGQWYPEAQPESVS